MGHKRGKNMGKLIDLTGKKFGRLTVVGRAKNHISPSGVKNVKWECQCKCGNKILVTLTQLKSGKVSCGCMKPHRIDTEYAKTLCGQKFGKLTILSLAERKIIKCVLIASVIAV